jgi:hypothetical protein
MAHKATDYSRKFRKAAGGAIRRAAKVTLAATAPDRSPAGRAAYVSDLAARVREAHEAGAAWADAELVAELEAKAARLAEEA